MSSREKILAAVKNSQPSFVELPPLPTMISGEQVPAADTAGVAEKFMTMLTSIGGTSFVVPDLKNIASIIREEYPSAIKILSACPGVEGNVTQVQGNTEPLQSVPHALADVDLAIVRADFAVAENGACWVPEETTEGGQPMIERILPFICQHLAIVLDKKNIVSDMHQAYDRIGDASYGFGTFIAGPSKTADIEQSLVLGAHGPKSLLVFLVEDQRGPASQDSHTASSR